MNALCAIDNGLLSPNGLLTPQPPTNLAVNYTITIPLDSDPDLVLHYPFNQNILNYGSSTSLSTNLGPNTGVSDATIVPASGSKVSLSSNQSIFNNGTSLYQSNSNNSSYLSIANIPTNSNGYSFSLWVYFTSISTSTGVIFSFTSGTSATNRIVFYTDSTQPNKLIFSCNNTPNFISNIYPVLNTWYHYVWTLDKINNNRIYVNGVLQVTATTPTYVSFTSDNNSIFGDKPFPSNYGQQGYMNDFRYYNRILDSAEVYQLYNIYSLKINSGFQWQAFYGIQTSITQITTYLPTTGSLNSFQYNSYYSGGNNNTLFSTSSNLLTTINYANTIASANNIFGFNTNTAGTANAGLNIGLLVYGYFRPDISGVWNLKLDTDNHGTLWFNDGSGGSSFWPPTDTNYRITGNVTVPSYNTASLIAGTYYPMQITWSQFIGGSKFIFSITPPSGTITTDGTGYFFSQKPTTPIYTDLSLVLYYPFDQNIYNYASGFPVLDSNFTGTKTNININNVTYKVGNGSLYKDASNNSQYLYFNTIPQNTGGYSFAFWFNFTSLITTGTFFSFGDGTNNIKITSNRPPSDWSGIILSIKSGGITKSIKTNYYPTTTNWNHYVWTLDTNSNSNFYVNGVLRSGFPNTDISYVSFAMNTNTNFILADDVNGAASVMGYLDDFRYYNSILTPTTIASLSNNQVSNFPVFAETLNTRLVLYYPFDEDIYNYASGTGVDDATISGDYVSRNTDNYIVGSGSLYKSTYDNTSYFVAPTLSANTGGYSFSLWVNFSSSSLGIIFSFANALSNTKRIYFYNNGSTLRISCNASDNNISNIFPSLNTWNHYVWTLDICSNNCFYINGDLISGFPNVSVTYDSFAMNYNWIFGDTYTSTGKGQQGYVDDFRYYNRILTQSEVTQLYNMFIPSYPTTSYSMILYYPFNRDISNYASGIPVTFGSIIGGTVTIIRTKYAIGNGSLYQSASNTTSYFSIPALPANTNGYTFALWLNMTSYTTGMIFSFANILGEESDRISFWNNNDTGVEVFRFLCSNENNGVTFSRPPLNSWNHYGLTLDTFGNTCVYINGVLLSSYSGFNPYRSFIMNVNRIFGDTNSSAGQQGYMDDFQYYDTVLTQDEIIELYETYNPSDVSANSLILYYPFNKDLLNYATGTGVSFGSKTGSGIDVSSSNYAIGSGSLYKSGSDNSSYFSPNALPLNTGGYTFALWVYFTSFTTAGTLFSFANASNSTTRIYLSSTSSNITIFCNNKSITNLTAPSQNNIWYHYTWTLDTNSNSNFYINGVLQSGFPSQTIPYASFPMSVNRIYGDTSGGNSGPGYIDDFRYYNAILDQTQVTELYEMYSPWTVSPNTNRLILYYPFNKDFLNYATGTGVSDGNIVVGSSNNPTWATSTQGLYNPAGIVIDPTNTYMYVAEYNTGNVSGNHKISRITMANPSNYDASWWNVFIEYPYAMVMNKTNTILYYTTTIYGNQIRYVNTNLGGNGSLADLSISTIIYGLAIDNTNTYLYAVSSDNTLARILLSNGTTNATFATATQGLNAPKALLIDKTNTYIYILNNGNNTIGKYSLTSPTSEYNATWATSIGLNNPLGIAVDSTNTYMYVVNNDNDTVTRITMATPTVYQTYATNASAGLFNPVGIAIDASNAFIYVSNQTGGSDSLGTISQISLSPLSLNNTNYVIGTGSLYKSYLDNAYYFSVNSLTPNTGGYTFALWVYFTNITTAGTLFSFANANNSATRIFFSNTGSNLSITCKNNSISDISGPTQNTWTHYTWTLDVNSNSNFYINGVLQIGFPSQTIPYASFSMNTNYIWGDTSGGSSGPGYIDDFRYYNTILNQTQVTELYNMKTDISNTGTLSLKLYYPFDTDISNYATGTGVTLGTISGGTIALNNTNYEVGTGSLYHSIYDTISCFNVTSSSALPANVNGYSFSFWFYLISKSNSFTFFSFGADRTSLSHYTMQYTTSIRIRSFDALYDTTFNPDINTWYHIVWTNINAGAVNTTGKNYVYLNGVIIYNNANSGAPYYRRFVINNFFIFGDIVGAINSPQGYIDDFRYYDGVLSQAQVTDLYNSKQPSTLTLILYYPFDTDISNYASGIGNFDNSGAISGSAVTLNNTIYAVGTGSLKNEFNKTDYFEISNIPINTAGYSFSFWMSLTSNSTDYAIFAFYDGAGKGAKRLRLWASGTGPIKMFSNTSPLGSYTSNFTPTLYVWYHIVWTIQTDNLVRFYANGILTETTQPTNFYQTFTSSSSIELFDDYDGTILNMAGYIDDFRYYDGILSRAQVTDLYNSKNPYSLTLKLYYPFDTDISNYASGTGVTFGSIGGTTVSLNYTNPIVGLGCLYQSNTNSTDRFNIPEIVQNLYGYSFSFWFYFTNLTTEGIIFSFTRDETNRIYIFNTGNSGTNFPANNLRFFCNGEGNNIGSIYPKLNTWYHYVWTLDTNSNNCIYINGVLQVIGNTTTPNYGSFLLLNNSILGDKGVTNKGQRGYIDDFRYYDGILNQAQVTDLYNMKGLFELKDLINTLSLLLYYPFNTDIKNYASGVGITAGTISGGTVSLSNTNYAVGTGSLYHSATDKSYFIAPALPANKNGYSFSFWFYFTSSSTPTTIFSFSNTVTATDANRIYLANLNSINFKLLCNSSSYSLPSDSFNNLNTWYHYVWTLDKSNKSYFYVNGVLQANLTSITYASFVINYNYILGDTNITGSGYNGAQGYIDDFRYYDGILSPTQVTDIYNSKNTQNFDPNTDTALCIYYPFDISRNYVVNYAASVYGVVDASYTSASGINPAVVDYTTNKVGTGALKLVSTSSQYVQLNSNSITQTTKFISPNGMSFSLWIKSNSTFANAAIFYFANSDTDYIGLFIDNGGIGISCRVYNTQLLSVNLTSPNYNNNIWRHVVWTLGYSSSRTSRWNIYIDGIMVSDTSNNYYPIISTPKTISRLGRDGGSTYYNGWIDDFRVYQRVLNQLEITQLYNYQDTSANFPTLNANAANFSWTPPERKNGVSYNYYYTDNTLITSNPILSEPGLQWKAFYGTNYTNIASSTTANSFQNQSRYSGGANTSSSTSSNVLNNINYTNNTIWANGNPFGFTSGSFISLIINGYFLPNQTGTWNFRFKDSLNYANDDFSVFWINDLSGTTNHWPPTDNNYNNYSFNSAEYITTLTAGIYYPMQLTWSQALGGSILGFAYKGPGMSNYIYDGTGFFFYSISAPIITNTKATNALIPEINIDNSNSYYVNSQRANKNSVYANITI